MPYVVPPLEAFDPRLHDLLRRANIGAVKLEFATLREARAFNLRFSHYRKALKNEKELSPLANDLYIMASRVVVSFSQTTSPTDPCTLTLGRVDSKFNSTLDKLNLQRPTLQDDPLAE